jgi:arabinogalactan endo-1,4-beta-galactosidase
LYILFLSPKGQISSNKNKKRKLEKEKNRGLNNICLRKSDSAKLNFRKASAGKNADLQSCISLAKKAEQRFITDIGYEF